MSERGINARRLELLAKVKAMNPSDIGAAVLLEEVAEFMETIGVYPSPSLVQAQGVADGNMISRLQGMLGERTAKDSDQP